MSNSNEYEKEVNKKEEPHFQVGAYKKKITKTGEEIFVGSTNINAINKLPEDMKQRNKAGEISYLKTVIRPFPKGTDQYGNTHYMRVDTFVPNKDYNKQENN